MAGVVPGDAEQRAAGEETRAGDAAGGAAGAGARRAGAGVCAARRLPAPGVSAVVWAIQ